MSGSSRSADEQPVPPGGQPADDFRLTRARRLTPAQFKEVFAVDRSFPGRFVVMWVRLGAASARRMGAVASRRSFHTAVGRNRARRLMREAFRLNRASLRSDADVILVARARLAQVRAAEVADDFCSLCRRAGIWEGEN
jgi:ribonuclease P protein component